MIDLLLSYIIFSENPLLEEEPLEIHANQELLYAPGIPRMPSFDAKPIPVPDMMNTVPAIDAKAVMLMDLHTGTVLYEKNANTRLPIASLTKIMTAVVALENYNLADIVKVTNEMRAVEGNKIWLYGGENISVEDLLKGALIASGNDAAQALAYHMGYGAFIQKMNDKAGMLNLPNTHFVNPVGLDHWNNYSSARDLASLARYALQDQTFRDTVQQEHLTITSVSGITHELHSTNQLFGGGLQIKGVKTGTTPLALECLVSLAENEAGHKLLLVVLGSTNRYKTSEDLLNWGFNNVRWE